LANYSITFSINILRAEKTGCTIFVGGQAGRQPRQGTKLLELADEEQLFSILEKTFEYNTRLKALCPAVVIKSSVFCLFMKDNNKYSNAIADVLAIVLWFVAGLQLFIGVASEGATYT